MVVSEQQLSTYIKKARLKFEDRAKSDILVALKNFTALNPSCRKHKFPDGIERECLCLHGTIPVKYRVSVWVLLGCSFFKEVVWLGIVRKKMFLPILETKINWKCIWFLEQHLQYSCCALLVGQSSLLGTLLLRVPNRKHANSSFGNSWSGWTHLFAVFNWMAGEYSNYLQLIMNLLQYPSYDTYGLLQVMTLTFQDKTPVYASTQPTPPPRASQPIVSNPTSAYTPPYPQAAPTNTPYPTSAIGYYFYLVF